MVGIKLISEKLGISKPTVMAWIEQGKIKAYQVGGRWEIDEEDLEILIKQKIEKESSMKENDLIIGANEIAQKIGRSIPTLIDYIKTRNLPAILDNGVWVSKAGYLKAWLLCQKHGVFYNGQPLELLMEKYESKKTVERDQAEKEETIETQREMNVVETRLGLDIPEKKRGRPKAN